MGFFKSIINKEDMEESDSFSSSEQITDKDLETLYKKLYMKIGRDFIHKDDFARVIEEVAEVSEIDEELSIYSNEAAMELAFEYKEALDASRENVLKYKDLIDLSE